jgi:hypothetical protein
VTPHGANDIITASIEIGADPASVYGLVADIPAMGRRSPECRRCVWVTGDHAATGARFKGVNRQGLLRWSTICAVEVADGRELVFTVVQGAAGRRTRWRYGFEPISGGTRVTESCEPVSFKRSSVLSVVLNVLRGGGDRVEQVRRGMQETLANLKREAEAVVVV